MNISTNTLLNMLNPQLSNVVKQKIEDAAVDGKVNLGNVVQDKTIQSLLGGLFKDIANGAQNKQQVLNLLQNSQQSLNFKSLSTDIKSLVNGIQNNSTLNSNLSQQVSALQNSLLDLGKIDFNNLKSTLSNSGIFLESKLSGQNTPLTQNLSTTIKNLSSLIDSIVSKGGLGTKDLSMIQKQIDTILTQQNLSDEMVSSTKNLATTLLKDIELLQNSLKSGTQNMHSVQKLLTSLEEVLNKANIKSDLVPNLKNLFTSNQSLSNNTQIKEMIQTHLQQIRIAPNIPNDLKVEVKNIVENLLKQSDMFRQEQLPVNKNTIVEVGQNIDKLQQKMEPLNLPHNIKQEIVSGLKEIFQSLDISKINTVQTHLQQITTNKNIPDDIKLEVKNAVENLLKQASLPSSTKQVTLQQNLTHTIQKGIDTLEQNLTRQGFKNDTTQQIKGMLNSSFDQVNLKTEMHHLRTTLSTLYGSIDQSVNDEGQKNSLKEQIQNLLTQHKTISSTKNISEQLPRLSNLIQDMKGLEVKLNTHLNQAHQQNIIPKDIASDLKGAVLQIQDQLDRSSDPVHKDLKVLVDKIGSQIDYFQLLSYTSNSSHTYISFLQDNIEDADIKFHKSKDDTFSCQINLTLKEKGGVKILLLLDKEVNLGVTIGIENSKFKEKIGENLQILRQGLNKAGLLLQSLNVFNLDENKTQANKMHQYQGDDHASFGLDLKA